jgi:hypothetical protein
MPTSAWVILMVVMPLPSHLRATRVASHAAATTSGAAEIAADAAWVVGVGDTNSGVGATSWAQLPQNTPLPLIGQGTPPMIDEVAHSTPVWGWDRLL